MSTKIFSPKGTLLALAIRQVLEYSPVLLGALKRTDISTSSPGATAPVMGSAMPVIFSPKAKMGIYPVPQVQEPVLRTFQVLTKSWPGAICVPSGTVTSTVAGLKFASSQGVSVGGVADGLFVGVTVLVGPVVTAGVT